MQQSNSHTDTNQKVERTLMNIKDLRNLDKDDMLGMLGLETKASTVHNLAVALAPFAVGLLVGVGLALALAPKSGRELRDDIRDRYRKIRGDHKNGENETPDVKTT